MRHRTTDTTMDFPGNVNTNVFIIVSSPMSAHSEMLTFAKERVEGVNWSRWSWIDGQGSHAAEDAIGIHLEVAAVVHELRENHAHVYYAAEEQQVWLFDLLGGPKTDALVQILASHGLSSKRTMAYPYNHGQLTKLGLSYGVLEVTDRSLFDPQVLRGAGGNSRKVSPSTADHNSPSNGKMPTSLSIYAKAMHAFSASLCHSLVKHHKWMLLGDFVCADLPTQINGSFGQGLLDPSATTTAAIKFEAMWYPTGYVTIFPTFSQVDRRCSVAHWTMATNQELQIGAPLLLYPSGICTAYRGMLEEGNELSSSNLISDSKARCTTFLNNHGLFVSPKAKWVLIEVDKTEIDHENGTNIPEKSPLTVWPDEYAICRLTKTIGHLRDLESSEPSKIVDPLARAESWYSGRESRAREVENARKEAENQLQQQISQKDSSDLDVSSEIASPVYRDIILPQDVSGIYPTPPDGLLSQVSETPASNIQHDASPNFANVGQVNDIHNHPGYNDGAHEDLFEDMDMDMVGEADFNFFDEPGMTSEDGLRMAQNAPGRSTPGEEKANDALSDAQEGFSSINDPAVVASSAVEDEAKPLAVDADLSPITTHSTSSLETKALKAKNHPVEEMPESTHGLQQNGSSSPDIAGLERGSYNPLSLANLDFESKYGNRGRFDSPPAESLDFHSSLLQSKDRQLSIHRIGFNLGSPDSLDSEDDVDDVDDETTNVRGYDINKDLMEMREHYSNKRKRDSKESVPQPATPPSPGSSPRENEHGAAISLTTPPPIFFTSAISQAFPTNALQSNESSKALYTSDGQSFIQVAQLVADQVRVDNSCWSNSLRQETTTGSVTQVKSLYSESLISAVLEIFPSAKSRQLIDLVESGEEESDLSDLIYKLDISAVGIQRTGIMTDISSSAIPFWEEISLGPRSGSKDLHTFCVFPKKEYFVRPAKTFLEMMKGAYQACNLGKHTHEGSQSAYPHGLVPVPTNGGAITKDIRTSSIKFAKHLAGLRLCGGNFVIYMLNTSDEQAIPDLCAAFLDLFQAYQSALEDDDLKNPNDIVLQIVPSSIVFASDKLVIPPPTDYKRLAFQVYDRCGPVGSDGQKSRTPYVCAPAICLPKPIPKAIDFKLTSDPSVALLDMGDSLHLAYKWEAGQQWLVASWTNSFGTLQWVAAYWLSEDEDVQKSISQAAMIMLETTMEMLQARRASYKLFVAKDGSIGDWEVDGKPTFPFRRIRIVLTMTAWTELVSERFTSLNMTLLNFYSDPSLVLFQSPTLASVPELSDLSSPVSTPYTTGLSPEVPTHISTPGGTAVQGATSTPFGENDPEARLIDITDETWAAIISSDAGVPTADLQNPVSKSRSYLIKRAGTQDQDGLLPIQLDIIRASEPLQPLMKEVLGMYRNLALLARVRNVVDPVKGTLPIHVALVKNAHAALCRTMHYGG